jgi:hypothetical protein
MFKRKADLKNSDGAVVAVFNETCHDYGTTVVTVRRTETLALYAKGIFQPVISIAMSDPVGTEISEFHGTSAVGCIKDGTGISLVKSPGRSRDASHRTRNRQSESVGPLVSRPVTILTSASCQAPGSRTSSLLT